jgi:hypothetical protein
LKILGGLVSGLVRNGQRIRYQTAGWISPEVFRETANYRKLSSGRQILVSTALADQRKSAGFGAKSDPNWR